MDPSPSSATVFFLDFSLVVFALLLVLLNGFFVMAEFAMVKVRATRIPIVTQHAGWPGQILHKVHNQLDAYLSACQLGITLSSLGLGWIGEPAFAELLKPLLSWVGITSPEIIQGVSFFTAFFIISYLHIVVGELAPKSWAIRQPERLSLWTAVPLYLFYWLMYPAIWLLNHSANAILRMAGQAGTEGGHEHRYSRDELKLILHSSRVHDPEDRGINVLASVMEMSELDVVDWANSREDMIQIDRHASLREMLGLIRRHKYSRYPVYDSEVGEYVGILHIKDLLLDFDGAEDMEAMPDWEDLLRPLDRISKHMPLGSLLERFRMGGTHFVLVEEADHRVLGFLTMEDVLEVLVGDIQDEHRKTERGILVYKPGKLLVRGDTPLFKLERLLNINLGHIEIEAETMAGLIYETLNRVPEVEDTVETDGLRITVKKMKGPKIVMVKVVHLEHDPSGHERQDTTT